MGSFFFFSPTADLQTKTIIVLTHNYLCLLPVSVLCFFFSTSGHSFSPLCPLFPPLCFCLCSRCSFLLIIHNYFPAFPPSDVKSPGASVIQSWSVGSGGAVLILVPVSVYSCTAVVISPHCLSAFPPSLSLLLSLSHY